MPRLGEQRSIEKTVYQNLRIMCHWGSWLSSEVSFQRVWMESGVVQPLQVPRWCQFWLSRPCFTELGSGVPHMLAIQTEENGLGIVQAWASYFSKAVPSLTNLSCFCLLENACERMHCTVSKTQNMGNRVNVNPQQRNRVNLGNWEGQTWESRGYFIQQIY